MFRAEVMIGELARHAPEMRHAAQNAVVQAGMISASSGSGPKPYESAPKTSIDYAVMERTTRAAVVEGRFRWSDIGSWDAVWQLAAQDTDGNSTRGEVELEGASNCLVRSDDQLTTVVGAKDLIVVATKDAVLVADKSGRRT